MSGKRQRHQTPRTPARVETPDSAHPEDRSAATIEQISVQRIDTAFAELGFTKEGRYWVHPDLDLLFEAPAPAGLPGEDAPRTEVEVDGLRVVILGIEDLLIDRLRAWVHWKSEEDGRWARRLALLHVDRIDWRYMRERTQDVPEEVQGLAEIEREACPS